VVPSPLFPSVFKISFCFLVTLFSISIRFLFFSPPLDSFLILACGSAFTPFPRARATGAGLDRILFLALLCPCLVVSFSLREIVDVTLTDFFPFKVLILPLDSLVFAFSSLEVAWISALLPFFFFFLNCIFLYSKGLSDAEMRSICDFHETFPLSLSSE